MNFAHFGLHKAISNFDIYKCFPENFRPNVTNILLAVDGSVAKRAMKIFYEDEQKLTKKKISDFK